MSFSRRQVRGVSKHEAELILSGRGAQRDDLNELERFVSSLREQQQVVPIASTSNALIAEAARTARLAEPRPGPGERLRISIRMPRWAPAAALVMLLFFFASVPVAIAANGSAPGDPLYALDRALERIGILDGGFDERLAEVERLNETGRHEVAVEHLEASLGEVQGRLSDRQVSQAWIELEIAAAALGPESRGRADEVLRVLGSGANPGQGNPGQGNPGQGNPGQGNQGQGNQGQGNPGQGNPGQGNPGQGNPGQGNPGQGNPGQGNPGQGN